VLGARKRGKGFLYGGPYVVTWAIGHLVGLAEPGEIEPRWKRWRREDLPILPGRWPLVVSEGTREQFHVVAKILTSEKIGAVICATDAGREGELIFRYLYEASGCDKPFTRLWISSLTPEAIRAGFENLRDGRNFDPLAAAARGRSRADWLVGMNLSRALTLAADETFSVGRVQTPTLAMVVERELAIRHFVPEDYLEVEATFSPTGLGDRAERLTYRGTWFRSGGEQAAARGVGFSAESRRLPADGEEAGRIVERVLRGEAKITSLVERTRRLPPPQLYDLTELQRHANRLYRFSAQKTLDLAQKLYQDFKLITYPRTDSRHLSTEVAATLPRVLEALREPYGALFAPGSGEKPPGGRGVRRFIDDRKVSDHHAILPTPKSPAGLDPKSDAGKIYDLIARRLIAAWHPDHVWAITTVLTAVSSTATSTSSLSSSRDGKSPAGGEAVIDLFHSSGKVIQEEGWKAVEVGADRPTRKPGGGQGAENTDGGVDDRADDEDSQALPAELTSGQPQEVLGVESVEKQTRPPRRFSEATLLTAMETAGKTLDDARLSAAMRERGLGTPATRAEIIETLLRREYIVRRRDKALEATERGIRLIARVHPKAKSPALTGEWEAELRAIERNQGELEAFMGKIETFVREVIGETLTSPPAREVEPKTPGLPSSTQSKTPGLSSSTQPTTPGTLPTRPKTPGLPSSTQPKTPGLPVQGPTAGPFPAPDLVSPPPPPDGSRPPRLPEPSAAAGSPPSAAEGTTGRYRSPTPPEKLGSLLGKLFGHTAFRPYQEAVCQAVTRGEDALLVMPTGAGKSLCYQLPGLARAGTTLVISPLIALMEDQVTKLQALGLAAERIHSGRGRPASREVVRAYREGHLDFLFIAPERLSVPGFPELLARHPPVLVAVDEAHCISQWGHDFRPDYRMLGQHLPSLRPAPIIAMTATATPLVQEDIAGQLGLGKARRFIHGFRRGNIAVEVVEMPPAARHGTVAEILADPACRPAIVYAPSRKKADALGTELADLFPAASYHAGMSAEDRDRVQSEFLGGHLEVIVATVAFGMGVDKADIRTVLHTGLPGTLEGYYQEIGRAGRDGKPSRAILLHSWADRRTHEYFFEKSYPEPAILARLYRTLGPEPRPREALEAELSDIDPEIFERALEQLWIHGGTTVHPLAGMVGDGFTRSEAGWGDPYGIQREHKRSQLEEISRFAQGVGCRMVHLVRHFGDREDSGRPCGHCDICAPEQCLVHRFRRPTPEEVSRLGEILDALRTRDGQSTGQLYREYGGGLERRDFEASLAGLARAGFLRISDDSFDKEGRSIYFQRAHLTREGLGVTIQDLTEVPLPEQPRPRPGEARKTRGAASRGAQRRRSKSAGATSAGGRDVSTEDASAELVAALKEWRLGEARRRKIPAFRIFPDRTLLQIAVLKPASPSALLEVKGVGPHIVSQYGDDLLRIVQGG